MHASNPVAHRDDWRRNSSCCYGHAVGPPAALAAPGVMDCQHRGQGYVVGRSRSRSVRVCKGHEETGDKVDTDTNCCHQLFLIPW